MRKISLLLLTIFLLPLQPLFAEIIYLKDGQVLHADIVKESRDEIFIKTKYQERSIKRSEIKRILYGERQMEKVYILFKNGNRKEGYLVDHDSVKVVIRLQKDSKIEHIYYKHDIKEMSNQVIKNTNFDIFFKAGYLTPFNSGAADFSPALFVVTGVNFNLASMNQLRIYFETGYVNFESKVEKETSLQVIPITASIAYEIPLYIFKLVPKFGLGTAMVEFNSKKHETSRGYNITATAGVGVLYGLFEETLNLGVWCEYFSLQENSTNMSYLNLSGSFHFRF